MWTYIIVRLYIADYLKFLDNKNVSFTIPQILPENFR